MQTAREVQATRERLWQVVSDVIRWPEWTPSMTSVEFVHEDGLKVGATVRIRQPRLRPLTWTVSAYEPGRMFAWQCTAAGVLTVAEHLIEPVGTGASRLTLTLEQTGLLARPMVLLAGRQTLRYMTMEADGLRAAAERRD